MIELQGKYNEAKIFTDNIDEETISQVLNLLNQESMKDSIIRIMPDTHAGSGCVIGTTMTLTDKVIPNLVGVDIGCGMLTIKLEEKDIDFQHLDDVIKKYVPSGANINKDTKEDKTSLKVQDLACYGKPDANIRDKRAYQSVGTLGGGNHFIEVDKDKDGSLYLVIHTGSRHLGIEICNYYQKKGYEALKNASNSLREERQKLLTELKESGRQSEISTAIANLEATHKESNTSVPPELAYVEGELFKEYIHDMDMVQKHAACNRAEIARLILQHANLHEIERFETIHNYIDVDSMILRKGSVSAKAGEKLIIPINMRDGSLVCVGKGNADWNYSAPHGAGRLLSRSKAKEQISLEDYKESMAGIWTSCVNQSTIDESAFAYKPMTEIMENIQDTCTILDVITPVYNYKASEMVKEKEIDNTKEEEIER